MKLSTHRTAEQLCEQNGAVSISVQERSRCGKGAAVHNALPRQGISAGVFNAPVTDIDIRIHFSEFCEAVRHHKWKVTSV